MVTWLAHRVVAFLLALLATAVIIAAVRVAEYADRVADRCRAARAAEQERQFADDVECFCMRAASVRRFPSGLVDLGGPNETLNGENR